MLNPMKNMDIEDRLNYANDIINNALTNINKYNSLDPKPLRPLYGVHVNNYKIALRSFKNMYYME